MNKWSTQIDAFPPPSPPPLHLIFMSFLLFSALPASFSTLSSTRHSFLLLSLSSSPSFRLSHDFPALFTSHLFLLLCLCFYSLITNSFTTGLTVSLGIWARRPALTQWVLFGCGVCRPLLAACDSAPGGKDGRCHCCCCRLCCWIQAFVRTHGCRRTAPYWAAVI